MLSVKTAKQALHFIVPVFVLVFSIFVLAAKIPEAEFVQESIATLDTDKTTVMEFAGATMASSLAISALPDDFASPLANSLADMNKYFVVILMALFLERLIVMEGVKIAFLYVIPMACLLYIASQLITSTFLRSFAFKVAVFGLAMVLVVPCSTHFTEAIGAKYLTYVDETISEAQDGADKINGAMTDEEEDRTIFEKLSDTFRSAIQGMTDLLAYFNNVIKRCINSIAILIVTTIVIPMLTLLLFKWLLGELFTIHITLPMPKARLFPIYGRGEKNKESSGGDRENAGDDREKTE